MASTQRTIIGIGGKVKIGDRVVADQKAMRRSCEQVPEDPAGQIVGTDEEYFVVRFDEDTADDALFLKSDLRPLVDTVQTVIAIRKHAFVPGGRGDAPGCWYEEDGFRCGFYRQFHEGYGQ